MAFIGAGIVWDDKFWRAPGGDAGLLRISSHQEGRLKYRPEQPGGRMRRCIGWRTVWTTLWEKSGRRQKVNEVMPAKGSVVGAGNFVPPDIF